MESPFIATSQISWKARRASNLGQLHSPADSKEVSEWHDACTIPVKNACHPAQCRICVGQNWGEEIQHDYLSFDKSRSLSRVRNMSGLVLRCAIGGGRPTESGCL